MAVKNFENFYPMSFNGFPSSKLGKMTFYKNIKDFREINANLSSTKKVFEYNNMFRYECGKFLFHFPFILLSLVVSLGEQNEKPLES